MLIFFSNIRRCLTLCFMDFIHVFCLFTALLSDGFRIPVIKRNMRRFSSEGSLLDLDTSQWNKLSQQKSEYGSKMMSVTCTPHLKNDELDAGSARSIPSIQEPTQTPSEVRRKELIREQSVSVKNLTEFGKQEMDHLEVCAINESCRAYSDSQLAAVAEHVMDGGEREGQHETSLSVSSNQFSSKSQEKHHHRARLSAAKLHLKSFFDKVGSLLHFHSLTSPITV